MQCRSQLQHVTGSSPLTNYVVCLFLQVTEFGLQDIIVYANHVLELRILYSCFFQQFSYILHSRLGVVGGTGELHGGRGVLVVAVWGVLDGPRGNMGTVGV